MAKNLLKSIVASCLILTSSQGLSDNQVTITDGINHEKDLVLETRLEKDRISHTQNRIMTLSNHRTFINIFDYNNDGFGKNDYVKMYHKSKKGDEIEAEIRYKSFGEYKAKYNVVWNGSSSFSEVDTSNFDLAKKIAFWIYVSPAVGDLVRFGEPIYFGMTKQNIKDFPIKEFNYLLDKLEEHAPGLAKEDKKEMDELKNIGKLCAERARDMYHKRKLEEKLK